ncbi:catalase, partial [Nostoc sp. 3335mG]
MTDMLKPPMRFTAALEDRQADEAETVAEMEQAFDTILTTTSQDYGRAVRAVHAKAHGILKAELTVHDNLRPEVAQGLFAEPGVYPVWMRFSTNPGDILDDAIGLPRGLAWKVMDVD